MWGMHLSFIIHNAPEEFLHGFDEIKAGVRREMSMEIDKHVSMLRGFLSTLFQPGDRVCIQPSLSEARIRYYRDHKEELPNILHKRLLFWGDGEHRKPRNFLKSFMVSPSGIRLSTVQKLRDFNALGYDIYFAINPLVSPRRCQKTVQVARHFILESDHDNLDDQMRVLEKYNGYFSALVYSGNKSIHAYAKISPAIPNPNCVSYGESKKLGSDTSAIWAEYIDLAKAWIDEMKLNGIKIDRQVIKDYSRVSRLPGFQHSKTGKESEIKWLNPKAQDFLRTQRWWNENMSLILGSPGSSCSLDELDSKKSCRVERRDKLDSHLLPYLGINYRFYQISGSWPECLSKGLGKGKESIGMTDVKPGNTFIDDLKVYWELKRTGIPRRHERIRLHGAMFTAAKIYGWTIEKLGEEWRTIVGINPSHIGCEIEEAVEDICRHSKSTERLPVYLPKTTTIPEPNFAHEVVLETMLEKMMCSDIANTKRLVFRVLLPLIRQFPAQCCRGTLGIKSKEMLLATIKGRYTPALGWMLQHRLISMTKKGYLAGKMTRTYAVNIPLILFLMGYSAGELDWNKAIRWDVAILGDIAA
jgi:hypothetical protein